VLMTYFKPLDWTRERQKACFGLEVKGSYCVASSTQSITVLLVIIFQATQMRNTDRSPHLCISFCSVGPKGPDCPSGSKKKTSMWVLCLGSWESY
jgi:hypothetical protein